MCVMEVRLNIDFSYAVGETKREKRLGRETTRGTCQFREMIPQPVLDRIVFNSHTQIYKGTNKILTTRFGPLKHLRKNFFSISVYQFLKIMCCVELHIFAVIPFCLDS